MTLPNFHAEHALGRRRVADHGRRRQDEAPHGVVPAMRDPTQQAYAECLAECRSSGGTNCAATCAVQTKPPVVYPSPEGPPPKVAACCAVEYAGCVAGCVGSTGPLALVCAALCSASYASCLKTPTFPCDRL